ncbi:hypothetical protein [Brevundimonas sp. Root1423]|uniref:hypothetical protein n=1 Tax=Brevundimonas sp. Root1423 TaxID=1736462 RepID=UPI0006F6A07D|nr:hypothetical protein [Brevundimonas sp. Root1423]KQY96637.1 hypothetical protein ASD25_01975 [Brevundimonas sp. Root1423]
MTKNEVINSVADDLNATEQAVDAAIARATSLVQAMIGARASLNLSPVLGADAQTKALEAIAGLSAARQAMVSCHAELAKDHRRLGWGTLARPPMDKGLEENPPVTGRLRAV